MNNNKNKQLLFSIIGIAILCIAVVGVTFAFFNYTRTGNTNTVQVGRIVFNTTQGDAINLSNAFPITSAQAQTDTTNAKTLAVTVTGDTSYSGGIEYLVTATDVHMTTTTGKNVPVTIEVSVTGNNSKTLGTSDEDYYTNRGGSTSIYKVENAGDLNNDGHILVGYIAPDNTETGVDGIINIKAYLNDADILISDTYNDGNEPTDEKGTPASLGEGKTVLTTSEWNSLTGSNALSFKIKVEAREGTWVEEPPKKLKNLIMSRVGQDGIVAVNTSGNLASIGDTIRDYRYSGGGRYCTYTDGTNTYNLQVEADTCDETTVFGGMPPSLYRTTADIKNYTNNGNDLSGTTYTRTTTTVQETNTVKNYIWFNNEMWRIVGIVDGNVKIVKDMPITTASAPTTYTNIAGTTFNIKKESGHYANNKYAAIYWNNVKTTQYNDWTTAGLMYYANENNIGSYYNTINATYKNMIQESTYYLSNVTGNSGIGTASTVYNEERATAVECGASVTSYSHNNSCNIWNGNQSTWTGKIALLYPSDFGYASSSSNWSTNISSYYNDSTNPVVSDNWLLNNDAFYNWFLSPSSLIPDYVVYWGGFGSVYSINTTGNFSLAWRPVLNLKSDALAYSGDGSYNDPYKLIQE